MAYIGRQPTVGNFRICDAISVVNGQAAYTMQVGGVNVIPESANNMIVSLNGVIQKPGSSYTVSSSTITFSSNLSTGDVIDFIQILGGVANIGTPSDGTVSTAKIVDANVTTAKIADANVTLAKLSATGTKDATTFLRGDNSFQEVPAGGITVADMYRINTDFNFSTSETFITANWERVDTDFDKIGTGITESSGVFSFPQTGIYLIQVGATVGTGGSGGGRHAEISTHFTTDNSTYTKRAYSQDNQTFGDGATNHFHQSFFDVTNVSTHKVKFATIKQSSSYNYAMRVDTNANLNSFSFIRLGDT